MKILANEFIIPLRQGWQSHASHILPLPGGEVYAVFFYGSREGNPDIRIYGALRSAAGRWSEAEPLTEDDNIPDWNPVLFRREDGTVFLFYKSGPDCSYWHTRCRISTDNCRSWGEAFDLVPGDIGGRGPVRNKPIYLADGSILAPGSTEIGEWKCYFDRSTDGGITWQRSEDVRLGDAWLGKYENLQGRGIIQPTIWQTEQGIHALMRSSEGYIFRTDSPDGIRWCAPYPTHLPNNNSGIDAVKLPDGRIILCCNPVAANWGQRTPLSLYISEDNGITFNLLTHLYTDSRGGYAYPALQYEDGKLHISYTWDRLSIVYMCLTDI